MATTRPPQPDETDRKIKVIQSGLKKLSRAQLLELADQVTTLETKLALHGPQTDDDLHAWVKENIGIDIPRVSVCDNHDPPFKFFSDLYFHRTNSALLMANRGGSKTFLVALLHLVNSKFKPHCESVTVGAIEMQAKRAYAHLLRFISMNPEFQKDLVREPLQSETTWKNGSKVEILPGTISAVNGPHPQITHADEVELMDEAVFDESRNMSMSGHGISAQDIITSTRKRGVGLMQRLIDEVKEAQATGHKPPYEMYQWCVFETSQKQDNCQKINPDHPNPCQCDKVSKGKWDDGSPRIFADVCGGRLARSEGWMPIEDVHRVFTLDSREMWESQQECIKPSTEGLVLKRFAEERHGVTRYLPDPENGPIFAGIDFGGSNPHAVIWFQLLRYEVDARTAQGGVRRLKEGSIVAFDEFYKAEIGNGQLADYIYGYEQKWKKRFEKFVVRRRFADPQGKAARLDLMHHRPQIKTSYLVTRDVKEHIKAVVALIDDDQFFVDVGRCKMVVEEAHAWHYPKKRPGMIDDPDIPVNDFDHCMAALRYGVANILYLEHRISRTGTPISAETRDKIERTTGVRPYSREGAAIDQTTTPVSTAPRYHGAEIIDSGIPWRQSIMP